MISNKDPGVHNWIDGYGLNYPKIMLRWQQLPRDADSPQPAVDGKLVTVDELNRYLPQEMVFISAEERKEQLKNRMSKHSGRYLDDQ